MRTIHLREQPSQLRSELRAVLPKERRDARGTDAWWRILRKRVFEEPNPVLRDRALALLHLVPPSSFFICAASWFAMVGSSP